MALTDFFRINLPYGIKRNNNGEWQAFNREYMPLGFNDVSQRAFDIHEPNHDLPIFTRYNRISEKILLKIAGEEKMVRRDEKGEINMLFLYQDSTNPQRNPFYWPAYMEKLQALAKWEVKK